MKIIVDGPDYDRRDRVYAVLDRWLDANQYQGCTLISGRMGGASEFAEDWFYERHLPVEYRRGYQEMLDIGRPWRVMAFPGCEHMRKIARRARVKVFEIPW